MRIYSKQDGDRWCQEQKNRKYLLVNNVVFCLIYAGLITMMEAEARASVPTTLFLIVVDLYGAMIFRDFLMVIPSYFFLRPVYPEIHLCEDKLIFLGGSAILDYSPMMRMLPFLKSMFATTPSISINRGSAIQVSLVRGRRGLSAPWKYETELTVLGEGTCIRGLGWLGETELTKIKDTIEQWSLNK